MTIHIHISLLRSVCMPYVMIFKGKDNGSHFT